MREDALTVHRDAVPSVFTTAAIPAKTPSEQRVDEQVLDDIRRGEMFELYGVGKDGMVYRSPPPRRKEVDILEVGVERRVLLIRIRR